MRPQLPGEDEAEVVSGLASTPAQRRLARLTAADYALRHDLTPRQLAELLEALDLTEDPMATIALSALSPADVTVLKAIVGGKGGAFIRAAYPDVSPARVEELRTAYPTVDAIEAAVRQHAATSQPGAAPHRDKAPSSDDWEDWATGLHEVRVAQVLPNPNNPRERMTDIDELASSVRENGLIQPIIVQQKPGVGLEVIAGHRRLEAVKQLGWFSVEVLVRKPMRADSELLAMLVENGQRAGLDPIEEARALARLKAQLGCSDGELAKQIGRTQVHVSNRLALLALPIEQQEEIRAGQLGIVAGTQQGRVAAGKVRPKQSTGTPHLGWEHDLAKLAKARCHRLQHKKGGRNSVGGTACGECWESVIRADERQQLQQRAATTGKCALCDTPIDPAEAAAMSG